MGKNTVKKGIKGNTPVIKQPKANKKPEKLEVRGIPLADNPIQFPVPVDGPPVTRSQARKIRLEDLIHD
jgi:hypothetical protein